MEWRERDGVRWLEADLGGARAAFDTRLIDHSVDGESVSDPRIGGLGQTRPPGEKIVSADGHVVREPGLAPLVFVADCLPVALRGPGGVAMVHAGWRGLAGGIVGAAAEAVAATSAAVGPGIGPCCYEVGEEVLGEFADLGDGVADGRMLDLPEVARRRLAAAGVERVDSAGLCTSSEAGHFLSHRREHGRTGRQAGMALIDA